MKVKVKSLSRVQLWDPVECSLPGSSAHGILQARILEWVAISFSRGSSQPRDWTWVSHIAGRRFNLWATKEAYYLLIVINIISPPTPHSPTPSKSSQTWQPGFRKQELLGHLYSMICVTINFSSLRCSILDLHVSPGFNLTLYPSEITETLEGRVTDQENQSSSC